MDQSIKKIARTGFAAKGTVYGLAGILTFMAAFNLGGQKTGKLQVLQFLDQQTFGNVLLVLMAIGLACYATWRFIEAVKDPEHIGNDKRGGAKRFAFFISGLIYLGLAILAILRVVGSGSSTSNPTAQKSSFLATETGLILIGIAGAGFVIAGFFQFVKAYKNDYYKKFGLEALRDQEKRETIKKTAEFGLSSRGVIFLIVGYFALKAAVSADPSKIKTTTEAFAFLQQSSYGAWLMGIVAAGLVTYAIYMFLMAKYRKFRG